MSPRTFYRTRIERPVRHQQEPTPRTNGASQDHPAAERRLSPTSPGSTSGGLTPRSLLLEFPWFSQRHSRHHRRGLRMTAGRRVHQQTPVLLLRPLRPDTVLHVPPQRDQELPRQRHDADLPRPLVPGTEAAVIPLAQRAPPLPPQPQPGQLHDQAAHVLVVPLVPAQFQSDVQRPRRGRGQKASPSSRVDDYPTETCTTSGTQLATRYRTTERCLR